MISLILIITWQIYYILIIISMYILISLHDVFTNQCRILQSNIRSGHNILFILLFTNSLLNQIHQIHIDNNTKKKHTAQ